MSGIIHRVNSQFPQSFTIQMPLKVFPINIIRHWFYRQPDVNKVRRSNPLPLSTYQREDEIILPIVTQTSTMSQVFVEEIDWTRLSLCVRRDGMNDTSLELSRPIPLPFENLYF